MPDLYHYKVEDEKGLHTTGRQEAIQVVEQYLKDYGLKWVDTFQLGTKTPLGQESTLLFRAAMLAPSSDPEIQSKKVLLRMWNLPDLRTYSFDNPTEEEQAKPAGDETDYLWPMWGGLVFRTKRDAETFNPDLAVIRFNLPVIPKLEKGPNKVLVLSDKGVEWKESPSVETTDTSARQSLTYILSKFKLPSKKPSAYEELVLLHLAADTGEIVAGPYVFYNRTNKRYEGSLTNEVIPDALPLPYRYPVDNGPLSSNRSESLAVIKYSSQTFRKIDPIFTSSQVIAEMKSDPAYKLAYAEYLVSKTERETDEEFRKIYQPPPDKPHGNDPRYAKEQPVLKHEELLSLFETLMEEKNAKLQRANFIYFIRFLDRYFENFGEPNIELESTKKLIAHIEELLVTEFKDEEDLIANFILKKLDWTRPYKKVSGTMHEWRVEYYTFDGRPFKPFTNIKSPFAFELLKTILSASKQTFVQAGFKNRFSVVPEFLFLRDGITDTPDEDKKWIELTKGLAQIKIDEPVIRSALEWLRVPKANSRNDEIRRLHLIRQLNARLGEIPKPQVKELAQITANLITNPPPTGNLLEYVFDSVAGLSSREMKFSLASEVMFNLFLSEDPHLLNIVGYKNFEKMIHNLYNTNASRFQYALLKASPRFFAELMKMPGVKKIADELIAELELPAIDRKLPKKMRKELRDVRLASQTAQKLFTLALITYERHALEKRPMNPILERGGKLKAQWIERAAEAAVHAKELEKEME